MLWKIAKLKKKEKQKNIFGISYPKEKTAHFRRNNIAFAYPIFILKSSKEYFHRTIEAFKNIHIFMKQLLKKEATNVTGRNEW